MILVISSSSVALVGLGGASAIAGSAEREGVATAGSAVCETSVFELFVVALDFKEAGCVLICFPQFVQNAALSSISLPQCSQYI